MSTTKKLTTAQTAALGLMQDGPCHWFQLTKVGANGSTIKALCNAGLANVCYEGSGSGKSWRITRLGEAALESGRYSVTVTSDRAVESCVAAIQFALETDEGLGFLRCWNEGDFDAIRKEWPDAPPAVFHADPLTQAS